MLGYVKRLAKQPAWRSPRRWSPPPANEKQVWHLELGQDRRRASPGAATSTPGPLSLPGEHLGALRWLSASGSHLESCFGPAQGGTREAVVLLASKEAVWCFVASKRF